MKEKQKKIKDYNLELQTLFLEMMLADPESFVRCQSIFSSTYFDKSLRDVSEFIFEYADKYKAMPTNEVIEASVGTKLSRIPSVSQAESDWLVDEFEQFCRHKALEKAIIESADLLEKGDYGTVETKIKEAVQIGLARDLGTNYFENPKQRLLDLKSNNGQVSTGWKSLDEKLFGGFNRGELQIFAGQSGAGKSLFLQNLALNWAMDGMNVVYFTLELSELLVAMRLDSMISNISSREIFKQIDTVELKVHMAGKKAGCLQVKYMPSQSTTNDLRSYLKEYQIQKSVRPDALLVDYLDLCSPNSRNVDPSDMFIKDKLVSEELRNLAGEKKCLLATASQLNRSGVEEVEFTHANISGGISKINSSDNVFGIFTSRAMRERGRYQLQFLKTRNSASVGQKIDLDFDVNTLRITDCLDPTSNDSSGATSIYQRLKNKTIVKPADQQTEDTRVTAEVNGSRLRGLIGEFKNK